LGAKLFNLLHDFAHLENLIVGLNKTVLAHSAVLVVPFVCITIGVVDTAGYKLFFTKDIFLR
jgi:hypothetical protein